MCVSINGLGDPDLWPFDLETGVLVASNMGNLPSKFGHATDARHMGSRIIRYVAYATDGRTKATLIAPSLRAGYKKWHDPMFCQPTLLPFVTAMNGHCNFFDMRCLRSAVATHAWMGWEWQLTGDYYGVGVGVLEFRHVTCCWSSWSARGWQSVCMARYAQHPVRGTKSTWQRRSTVVCSQSDLWSCWHWVIMPLPSTTWWTSCSLSVSSSSNVESTLTPAITSTLVDIMNRSRSAVSYTVVSLEMNTAGLRCSHCHMMPPHCLMDLLPMRTMVGY